jgi:small-conductance mechanosensitive channel
MLEWFAINSVWTLIASTAVLLLLLFVGRQIRDKIEKALPKKWHRGAHRSLSIGLWTIEGIILVIIVLAVVSIIMPREGAAAIVTTETIQKWFQEHGVSIFAILVLGVGLWFALDRFLPLLVRRTMVKTKGESREGIKKRTDTLVSVFTGAGKIIVILLAVFMVLSELNVPIGPVLAGFGVVGIAVGFGAQYLIRDLIAGIFIILENQYRVGDVAKVADIAGLVEEVRMRKTVLRDLDGIVHHVPNGEIRVASNYTRHFARVNLDVPVAYGTDLDYAINVINRVGQELAADEKWAQLIESAPQVLRVDKFGDSGIDIKILGNVKPMQQWAVMGELRLRLKKAFDEEGIEIPWPHVKLYLGQSQASGDITCKACSHVNLPGSKFCSNCGASLSP